MKNELKYELESQFFAEEPAEEATAEVETETEPTVDLSKLEANKGKDNELSELDRLKAELEQEKLLRAEAEDKERRAKAAFDKKASEAAKKSREAREATKMAEEPLEKIAEYEAKIAEFELNEKKNDAFLGLTEIIGITKDHSQLLVSSLYHEDTNEVSVPDLVENLGVVLTDVIKQAREDGYNTAVQEAASGKPRSIGAQKGETVAQRKQREYLEQYK